MALAIEQPSKSTSRLSVLYLTVWCLLAAAALGYLALLALRPDLATRLILGPSNSAPEGNFGQRAVSKLLTEIGELRRQAGKHEAEMGELRAAVAAEQRRALSLEGRVAAVEAQLQGQGAPVARASPAAQRSDPAAVASGGGTSVGGQTVDGTIEEPRPTMALREGWSTTQQRVATASTAAAVPAVPAEPVKGPPAAVLLSTSPSLDAIRLSWQLLLDGNKSTLKSLEPRYLEAAGDPPAYQLLAGPLTSREAATRLCDRLKARQVRCSVATFAGQPL